MKKEKQNRIDDLVWDRIKLNGELSSLTGAFKANRRNEIEAQIAKIDAELSQLKGQPDGQKTPSEASSAVQTSPVQAKPQLSASVPAPDVTKQQQEDAGKRAVIQRAREAFLYEKEALEAELPTLKGMFKAGRRKEVEARIAKLEENLKKLQEE